MHMYFVQRTGTMFLTCIDQDELKAQAILELDDSLLEDESGDGGDSGGNGGDNHQSVMDSLMQPIMQSMMTRLESAPPGQLEMYEYNVMVCELVFVF